MKTTAKLWMAAIGLFVLPVSARAQCTGDCGSDQAVTVDEIITGVNIALGTASLEACTAFDGNADSMVTVDEIVTAVNNALVGCPAGGVCGDGNVDFEAGETCDDHNTVDGDSCPADCRIETCDGAGTTLDLRIAFTPPSGVELTAMTIFLRYPDGVVRIPGLGNDALVQSRMLDVTAGVSLTPNDLDYALRLVGFSPDLSPIAPGRLVTVQFDRCAGATTPALDDFTCAVEDAADLNLDPVAGVTCQLSY